MHCTFRRAAAGDVERLGPFAASLFRQAYEPTHPEPTLSAYLASAFAAPQLVRAVTDPGSTILLAEGDGSWIGYAELREGAPDAPTTTLDVPLPGLRPLEIVRFYVGRDWQGRGVARELMLACEKEALARGCDVVWLQAWQQAPQALRFYDKCGLEVIGTAVFTFGERADADYILARALPPADDA